MAGARASHVIGRYVLSDPIAAGGMATVHAGRLLGPVGFARTVAIKRLHPHLAQDREFVTLLLDEARLSARIRHPNVIQTLDVVTADGELFIVMEYVEGESLSRLTRKARDRGENIPPRIASAILSGVLHGLHAAHETKGDRGEPLQLVHRDVSPQNILVGTDGVSRVLDFGVAKAASRLQTTRDGQVKGKLSYMAPEQIRARPVSRRTDVYAAAVVLWETITGRRLFSGDNDGTVLEQVLLGAIDPPTTCDPSLPDVLDTIVMRGLDRDPEKRFASAREMALALERGIPPALASEVGEWALAVAGEDLTTRAALISELEATPPDALGTANHLLGQVEATRPREAIQLRSGQGEALGSQVSTLSVSLSKAKVPGRRNAWPGLLVGGAAMLAAGLLWQSSRTLPARQASPPTAPIALASGAASSSASAAASATSATVSSDTGAAVATSTPPPASASAKPRRAQSPSPPANCNPPYTRDAAGRTLWKRECL